MPKPVHEAAYYYDESGASVPIRVEELNDDEIYKRARSLVLHDKREQVRLIAREAERRIRHFAINEESPEDTRVVLGDEVSESSKEHQDRLEQVLRKLSAEPYDWAVAISRYKARAPKKLFDLFKYEWGREVHRIISREATVRHDLFGQSSLLGMSIMRPWVAIEIVHTHYPDSRTFDAFIDQSRQVPFLVMFDSTARSNTFLKIDHESRTIFPMFYILDGAVWKDGERTNINSAESLAAAINSKIVKLQQGGKRSTPVLAD